ncbi:MAG: DUF4386 domain-containing protein [Caldilineaceae bacterium]
MPSIQKTARIAGILYLLMAPLGAFGILYIPTNIIVPDDAVATAGNILADMWTFQLSAVSALVTQVIQIFLVLFLYRVLTAASKAHATLMVIFILVAVPIAMLNDGLHFVVLHLLSGAEYLRTFTEAQRQTLALLLLDWHETGVQIASIFWGLWLLPMGYAIFKSGYLPRILGILLMIGCFGYLFDSFTALLLPDFGFTIAQFTFIGELLLPLWLLMKGVNVERWEKRALEIA